jgi:hypothetical protein
MIGDPIMALEVDLAVLGATNVVVTRGFIRCGRARLFPLTVGDFAAPERDQ